MNDPFRYSPSDSILKAAENLINRIDNDKVLHELFSEGKMMGVLEVEDDKGQKSFLYAFSGNVQGKNNIEGFVPPIYDLLDPSGYFKAEEAKISKIAEEISALENSYRYNKAIASAMTVERDAENTIAEAKLALEKRKQQRDITRQSFSSLNDEERAIKEAELIRQSQFDKAEYRRLKKRLDANCIAANNHVHDFETTICHLREKRHMRSDALQKWIFQQFKVHNALGECLSIEDVFKLKNIVPPGGTGECAAPKLLEFAYRNHLTPVSIGEFWYGDSSSKSIHTQGCFYPSCMSKCGPLLEFMLKGLDIDKPSNIRDWNIIYEDKDIIVADKPSGMLSAPGKTGEKSLLEELSTFKQMEIYSVHRLDMDTSGIIVYAKTPEAQANLQRQFESRTVEKEYTAILEARKKPIRPLSGTIKLPIGPDYENRPRQKVDSKEGKEAVTKYVVYEILPDGRTRILFYPKTGRTHQLRIHSAHKKGLDRPICGDRLYGSNLDCPLQLTATRLELCHPRSHETMIFHIGENREYAVNIISLGATNYYDLEEEELPF